MLASKVDRVTNGSTAAAATAKYLPSSTESNQSPMSDMKDTSAPNPGSGGSPLSQPAHTLTYDAVIEELGTGIDDGLTLDEASCRLQKYGPNKLDEGEGVSLVKILVRQVANAMMLVKAPTFLCDYPLRRFENSMNLIQFVCCRC